MELVNLPMHKVNLVRSTKDWPWSCHHATAGVADTPLTAILNKQPSLELATDNVASLREILIKSAIGDSTLSKIQRKAVSIGIRKCRLDDIDFQQPNLNLPALISSRVMQVLQEASSPTYRLFLAAVAVHALLFVLALVLDRV